MQKFITTYVDGTDVKEVNLWDHMTKRDKVVAVCKDDDIVTLIESKGVYSKIKTDNGQIGWCMSGFLK